MPRVAERPHHFAHAAPRLARIAADVDQVGPVGGQPFRLGEDRRQRQPRGVIDFGQNLDVVRP